MHARLTVNRLFSEQALRNPDAIAVTCGGTQLSYRRLNNCANHLARRLVDSGVNPGDNVVLCMPRSVESVVAMLAVLKAGAAFVPLDPSLPEALRRDYLSQSAARHVIVASGDDSSFASEPDLARISAADFLEARDIEADDVEASRDAEMPVYIMFTSGSTGKPKGVVIPHRGVVRLVCGTDYVKVGAGDTLLLLSPITFDASTFEIWGALLNGARLVVYEDATFDPNRLLLLLKNERVSVLWLTAALFHLIVRRHIEAFSGLRVLLAGGDVLQPGAVNAVLDACPSITMINGYGPTENTTFTCCHPMTRANRPGATVPIGRAIDGTRVHIVDAHLRPVNEGEVGELCASGLGVALGYLNAPEATRVVFVESPLVDGLLYRTGDLVRSGPNGLLEFLGRRDRVTKIRGFRVSVDEVQLEIARIPGVDECIVELGMDPNGEKRLHAFVQTSDQCVLTPSSVRSELRKSVPGFMVPDDITICSELPLNANGKVDRNRASGIAPISGERNG
jgi:amino acid adenylation domain-containing protein